MSKNSGKSVITIVNPAIHPNKREKRRMRRIVLAFRKGRAPIQMTAPAPTTTGQPG